MSLLTLICLSYANGKEFCIKDVRNEFNEPYLSYALIRTVERAVIEMGGVLDCDESSVPVLIKVESFRETPIAYTPDQRVSSYILSLGIRIRVDKRDFSLRGTVPYSLPSGAFGDIPRRKAIDDLLDKIYLKLLENLKGGMEDADKRGEQ